MPLARLSLPAMVLLVSVGCGGPTPATATDLPAVASVSLAFQSWPLMAGSLNRVVPTLRDVDGTLLDAGAYDIAWSVGDTTVAQVDDRGVIGGSHVGSSVVTATVGSVSGSLPFTILAGAPARTEILISGRLERVGDRAAVRGIITDAFGNEVRDVGVTCSCWNDESVAREIGFGFTSEIEIVATGQFSLTISDRADEVPGLVRIIDVRE